MFFLNDTPTTEIYPDCHTLPLHAALPIFAAKLCLKPGQRVLDIGCGWGGLALYLNRVADVDVLGITLSEEQFAVAQRRAAEAGVSDRVKLDRKSTRLNSSH